MDFLDDLAGPTDYAVRDALGCLAGVPSSVLVDADRAGATLLMGFAVVAGSPHARRRTASPTSPATTCSRSSTRSSSAEDASEPALDAGISTVVTVSGESNDV
jgi:hypothetical protein